MFWILFSLFLFLNPYQTDAIDEFSIKQNINYTVNQTGDGEALHRIEITNNYSQLVPKEYSFSLSGLHPLSLQAYDNFGPITVSTTISVTDTQIKLTLPRSQAGKNQITSFFIHYRLSGLATAKGKTWEITLPQFQSNLKSSLTVNLKVPISFGRLSFSPNNSTVIYDSLYSLIRLEKFDPLQKNVFILGNIQLFDFNLKYYLKNQNPVASLIPISIPPDTSGQKIIFTKINPRPQNIESDDDGNWLAYFLLPPNASVEIEVTGQAKIGSRQSPIIPPDSSLSEQLYWPISHPDIKALAAKYTTPKSIFDFVVSTLSYNDNRLDSATRRGALETLKKPSDSLCTDFTDLFITIARSAGIPAREIEGFAYSNNLKIKPLKPGTDLLHAWPEYYHPTSSSWVAIDPTWTKTTNGVDYFRDLDLNHLTFVIHQSKSDYPPPPGSYKLDPQQKTVEVVFANSEINPPLSLPDFSLNFLPFSPGQMTIKNPNLQAIDNLNVSSSLLELNLNLPSLPPLSSYTVNLSRRSFLDSLIPRNQKINLSVSYLPNYQTTIEIANPFHYLNLLATIIISLIILSIGGIILSRNS
jgi:hypothetical protein